MKIRTLLFASMLLGLASASTSLWAQATPGGHWRADIDEQARRLTDSGHVPGLSVAVVVGDRVAHSAGYGLADVATGVPADAGTRFYIASSTKALTATAVLRLAEQGVVDLEDPVTDYLPDLAFGEGVDADQVTLHDLLSMTEGIGDDWPVIFRTAYSGEFSPEQLIDLFADYGADDDGEGFEYSNVPYNVLGLVVDQVDDGQLEPGGWKSGVRKTVLDPLGMTETTARPSSLEADRLAMPHDLEPSGEFARIRLAKGDSNMHAAGGHLSSARALGRFVAAHVGSGTLAGRRIFSTSLIEQSHVERASQDRQFNDYARDGWSYGWDHVQWGEHRMLQRFGGFAGYFSHMSFLPEQELGVVVLSNGGGYGVAATELLAQYIYDRLLGLDELESSYVARLEKLESSLSEWAGQIGDERAKRAERLQPLDHDLSAYAGSYRNTALGTMQWRVVAGGLEVNMGEAFSRAEIHEAAEDRFRVTLTGRGSVADFSFEERQDRASSVTVGGHTFTRVEP